LLKDPELRGRFGAAGRVRACARFSAERMVLDTLRAYRRAARHPHVET
jgi:hypothetical protein